MSSAAESLDRLGKVATDFLRRAPKMLIDGKLEKALQGYLETKAVVAAL